MNVLLVCLPQYNNYMQNCRKTKYPNRKEAIAAMNDYNKRHDVQAKSVYKCPYHVGYWHFTTQNHSDSKRDRKWHIAQVAAIRPKYKRKNKHK